MIQVNVATNEIPYYSNQSLEQLQINILLLPLQQYLVYALLFVTTQTEMEKRQFFSYPVNQLIQKRLILHDFELFPPNS